MHNTLRPNVHPAARRHLAVVGYAHGGRPVEAGLVVKLADHQAVRNNNAGGSFLRAEQSQRMTGHYHESLLTGLPVGSQLIGIQGYIEIQVVVNHDLESFSFGAFSLVFVNGFSFNRTLGTEAVAVDAASLFQFFGKFFCHLLMILFRNIPESVHDGRLSVGLAHVRFSLRRAPDSLHKAGILRKLIQLKDLSVQIRLIHSISILSYGLPDIPARIIFSLSYSIHRQKTVKTQPLPLSFPKTY